MDPEIGPSSMVSGGRCRSTAAAERLAGAVDRQQRRSGGAAVWEDRRCVGVGTGAQLRGGAQRCVAQQLQRAAQLLSRQVLPLPAFGREVGKRPDWRASPRGAAGVTVCAS